MTRNLLKPLFSIERRSFCFFTDFHSGIEKYSMYRINWKINKVKHYLNLILNMFYLLAEDMVRKRKLRITGYRI